MAKFCDILRLDPRGLPAADSNTETGLRSEFGPNEPRASPWTGTDGRYPRDRCGGPGRRHEPQSSTVGARPQAGNIGLYNPCGLDYFLKGGMIQECNSHNAIIISHCVYTRAARPARGDAH